MLLLSRCQGLRTELAILPCPGGSVEELLQCLTGRHAQGIAPLCELHDIETAFPALDLGDERLSVPEPFADLGLREPRTLSPRS